MGYNYLRDKHRKHVEKLEIMRAVASYDSECGEVVTKKLSPEEIEERNKKINKHMK